MLDELIKWKTELILKFNQNLFSKVIWSSTFNITWPGSVYIYDTS